MGCVIILRAISRVKGFIRLFYRDFVLWVSDATTFIDEIFTVRILSGTGTQYYWNSLDVHRTLLMDEVRLEAFRQAISEVVKEGDTVLDLGTGTGILSFYAAEAGAGKVYAVDSAKIIDVGRKAAERQGIGAIEFMRTDVNDLNIPKVDCIISELIGMEIIDEGIADKIRTAKKYLRDGGAIIPGRIDVVLAPVETTEVGLGFWKRMHGVDYSVVGKVPDKIRNFEAGPGTRRLSPDLVAFSVDLHNPPKKIRIDAEFTIREAGEFTGCLMYFRAHLSDNVLLSSAPEEPLTHWKQIFIPHQKRLKMGVGDKVRIRMKPAPANFGWKWKYDVSRAVQTP
ncbi:MAG: methyltransferase domain-containing protein [Candidatus Altiarchaeota archaeon]